MKIKLKNTKGFTTVDLAIAMIIVIMFATIMASISYNVYLSTVEAKRTAVALNYAVDIFEHIGKVDFEEVTGSYELFDIDGMEAFTYESIDYNSNITTIKGSIDNYNITLVIEDYNSENVIKIITLTIDFPVSKKQVDNNTYETVELQRLKTIEDLA